MDNFIIQNEAVRVKIGINFDSLIPTPAPRPHIPNKSTPPLTHGKLLIPSSGRDCHFLTFSIISRANNNRDKSSKKRFLSENIPYLKTIWYIVRDKEHLRGYWSLKFESPVPFQGESNQYYGNYEHEQIQMIKILFPIYVYFFPSSPHPHADHNPLVAHLQVSEVEEDVRLL